DPNADKITGQVMALRQRMQGLARNVFLGDLTLEFDAGRRGAWPWLPSLEARQGQFPPAIGPPSGAHSNQGSKIARRMTGRSLQIDLVRFAVQNDGSWRHSATKYLRQPQFCGALRSMLEL